MILVNETRDERLDEAAMKLGVDIMTGMEAAGLYDAVTCHGCNLYVSGQIPRSGSEVLHAGRVGEALTLEEGHLAAAVCAIRALAVLRHHLGTLDLIEQAVKLTVYIQTDQTFIGHTSVADGASAVIKNVLGLSGAHSRTAVGVASLPRNAAAEAELHVVKKSLGRPREYGDLEMFRR